MQNRKERPQAFYHFCRTQSDPKSKRYFAYGRNHISFCSFSGSLWSPRTAFMQIALDYSGNKKSAPVSVLIYFGGATQNRTGGEGCADLHDNGKNSVNAG